MSVEAVYFDGYSSSNINGDIVYTNPSTAIYHAPNGTYQYSTSTNTIKLTATLSPMIGRMRFKSAGECKTLSLNGVVGYTGYNVTTGKFTTTATDGTIELDVDTAGYAGYVYGYYSNTSSPSITITYTDSLEKEFQFKADMTVGSMDAGKSGWMNIPTPSKRSGWNMTYLSYKGHELVDLALPSGLLWAKYNVGATEDYLGKYGNYYAWGEINTKSSYTADNSTTNGVTIENLNSRGYLDENGNLALQYDAANKIWGGTWRMPTKEEMQELLDNCTIVKDACGNGLGNWHYGLKFSSKINNNTIFLPFTGYYSGSSTSGNPGSSYAGTGEYWSSTPSGNSSFYLSIDYSPTASVNYQGRSYGCSIRPVTKP